VAFYPASIGSSEKPASSGTYGISPDHAPLGAFLHVWATHARWSYRRFLVTA
jgi:hypothetical protein